MESLKLPSEGRVYLDANCFIYRIEGIRPYFDLLQPLFASVRAGILRLVTSELSLLECLVKPVRDGNHEIERLFRAVLTDSQDVSLIPSVLPVLERAVNLRAKYGLKTPDAIHAASALLLQSSLMVTNDAVFRKIPELAVTVLHELTENRP